MFTNFAIRHNVNSIGGSQFTFEIEKLCDVVWLFRRDGTSGKSKRSSSRGWALGTRSTMGL